MFLTKIKAASSAIIAVALMVGGGIALHSANVFALAQAADPPAAKSLSGKLRGFFHGIGRVGEWSVLGIGIGTQAI